MCRLVHPDHLPNHCSELYLDTIIYYCNYECKNVCLVAPLVARRLNKHLTGKLIHFSLLLSRFAGDLIAKRQGSTRSRLIWRINEQIYRNKLMCHLSLAGSTIRFLHSNHCCCVARADASRSTSDWQTDSAEPNRREEDE